MAKPRKGTSLSSIRSYLTLFFIGVGVLVELWISFAQMSFESPYEDQQRDSEDFDFPMHHESKTRRNSSSSAGLKHDFRSGHKPRVVYLEGIHGYQVNREVDPMQQNGCHYCQIEADAHIFPFERPFYEECELFEDWQNSFFPTCNVLHEVSLATLDDETVLLSSEGSWRTVWKHEQLNQTVILKILRDHKNFTHESFEYHQADIRVMEKLTASPYIIDAFGFCGQSVLTEYAQVSARRYIKAVKRTQERVMIARDLAAGLEDLHNIGNSDDLVGRRPTVAHNDVNIANAVMIGNQVKLNDFNLAVMMRKNKTSHLPCGYPVRFDRFKWASPEDVRNTSYVDPSKADVYSLGNLLFTLLTNRQPWTHLEIGGKPTVEEVSAAKLKGQLPNVPEKYINTTKVGSRSLFLMMKACFEFDPMHRMTSTEVLKALNVATELTNRTMNKIRNDQLIEIFEMARKHPN